MGKQELAAKILELAQEFYEYREGDKKDEEFEDDALQAFEILQGEMENW